MDGVQLPQRYRASTVGDSLLFTTYSPEIRGTYLIHFGRMKG